MRMEEEIVRLGSPTNELDNANLIGEYGVETSDMDALSTATVVLRYVKKALRIRGIPVPPTSEGTD